MSDWKRIPSLDQVHVQLVEEHADLMGQSLLLGPSTSGTPILAFGPRAGEKEQLPVLLLIGAPTGDAVISVSAAQQVYLQAQRGELLPDWAVWWVPGLDLPRLAANHPQLKSLNPDADTLVRTRRQAWGPGEDPLSNLPIDHPPLYQPQEALPEMPEGWVASSRESVALGRALHRLRPQLMVSLHDIAAGAANLYCSQDLLPGDFHQLAEPLTEAGVPLNLGGKMREARQSAQTPGCLVLPGLRETLDRLTGSEDSLHLGGVPAWQIQQLLDPDSMYLSLDLPRLLLDGLDQQQEQPSLRDVSIDVETHEHQGKVYDARMIRLHRPGSPLDGILLRKEPIKASEPAVQAGVKTDQAAASGWLAVEAHMHRQQVLGEMYQAFQNALSHLEGDEYGRAMQLLRSHIEGQERLVGSYQNNKRFGRPATQAEVVYWEMLFPFQTALILGEARSSLRPENDKDVQVAQLAELLDEAIAEQLAPSDGRLRGLPAQQLAELMGQVVQRAAAVWIGRGPQEVLARQRVEEVRKAFDEAQRAERRLRQLKRPRAEQREAKQQAEQARQRLEQAEQELNQLISDRNGVNPVPEASPDSDPLAEQSEVVAAAPAQEREPTSKPRAGQPQPSTVAPEPATKPEVRSDSAAEENMPQPVPDLASEQIPEEPPPDKAVPERPKLSFEDLVATAKKGTDEPPAEKPKAISLDLDDPPQAEGSRDDRPESLPPSVECWLPEGQLLLKDLEQRLPEQLDLPPEWGRGPLVWSEQIPSFNYAPPFRRAIAAMAADPQAGEAQPAPTREAEQALEAEPSVQVQTTEKVQRLGDVHGDAVGFIRRRVNLSGSYHPVTRSLVPPPAHGGPGFVIRRRRLPS